MHECVCFFFFRQGMFLILKLDIVAHKHEKLIEKQFLVLSMAFQNLH